MNTHFRIGSCPLFCPVFSVYMYSYTLPLSWGVMHIIIPLLPACGYVVLWRKILICPAKSKTLPASRQRNEECYAHQPISSHLLARCSAGGHVGQSEPSIHVGKLRHPSETAEAHAPGLNIRSRAAGAGHSGHSGSWESTRIDQRSSTCDDTRITIAVITRLGW